MGNSAFLKMGREQQLRLDALNKRSTMTPDDDPLEDNNTLSHTFESLEDDVFDSDGVRIRNPRFERIGKSKVSVEKAKNREEVLTDAHREAAERFIMEYESECRALAETASVMAEQAAVSLQKAMWRRIVLWTLSVVFLPVLVGLHMSGFPYTNPVFWAVAIPMVITHIWNWVVYENIRSSSSCSEKEFLNKSSKYLALVDTARHCRIVEVPAVKTVGQVVQITENLASKKDYLDSNFAPSTSQIQIGRERASSRAISEIDMKEVVLALKEPSSHSRLPPSL